MVKEISALDLDYFFFVRISACNHQGFHAKLRFQASGKPLFYCAYHLRIHIFILMAENTGTFWDTDRYLIWSK